MPRRHEEGGGRQRRRGAGREARRRRRVVPVSVLERAAGRAAVGGGAGRGRDVGPGARCGVRVWCASVEFASCETDVCAKCMCGRVM
eukprot:1573192-Rhodomonas_salina.1